MHAAAPPRWSEPRPGEPWLNAAAPGQLGRCLLLAALLHLWLLLWVGNVPGGSATPGQGVWGAIDIRLGAVDGARAGAERPVPPSGPPGDAALPRAGGAVRRADTPPADTTRPGAQRLGVWRATPGERVLAAPSPPTGPVSPQPDLPPQMPLALALPALADLPAVQAAAVGLPESAPGPAPEPAGAPVPGPAAIAALPAAPLPIAPLPIAALPLAPLAVAPLAAVPAPTPVLSPVPKAPPVDRVADGPLRAPPALGPVADQSINPADMQTVPDLPAWAPALPSLAAVPENPVTVARLPGLAEGPLPAAALPVATTLAVPAAVAPPPELARLGPPPARPPADIPRLAGGDGRPGPATPAVGAPDAGAVAGVDRATPAAAAASAAPLDLRLPPLRAGALSQAATAGVLPLLPRPPELKTPLEKDLEKAAKTDCRSAHRGAGLLALVPLVRDAVTGEGCKW